LPETGWVPGLLDPVAGEPEALVPAERRSASASMTTTSSSSPTSTMPIRYSGSA